MNRPMLKKVLRESAVLGFMLIGILAARSTLADHYHVPTGSMEPNLVPGDHVLVNKAAYGFRVPFTKHVLALAETPVRGEVVIFDAPEDGTRLIKRVVAVGGDRVTVRDGRVYIQGVDTQSVNGLEAYGERTVPLDLAHGGGPDLAPIVVPDGHVLVLGDHRGRSRDGRYFGVVPVSELYGRASGVFWRSSDGPTWHNL